jgi:hypothetical protein
VLDPQALGLLQRFAADADRQAAGALEGLYGVGSVALGDWRPEASNLDLVAVSGGPWSADAVRRLSGTVGQLGPSRRQAARAAFVTWSDLAADPSGLDAPVLHGAARVASAELVNPLTWHILRVAGICTRGPEYPEVWAGAVEPWANEQLARSWPRQLERWRRFPFSLWFRRRTAPAVLEVARLSVVADTGRVVSKLEAGESLLDGARSSTQRILRDSIGYRQGSRVSMYWGPWERKRDTVAWIKGAVERARLV